MVETNRFDMFIKLIKKSSRFRRDHVKFPSLYHPDDQAWSRSRPDHMQRHPTNYLNWFVDTRGHLNLAIACHSWPSLALFARFVSTRLIVFAASVLANATPSRETGVVRELVGLRSPSHEPSQAPNDPYGALRAAKGHSRLKWRRSPLCCGWSVPPIVACAPDALVC